MLRRSHATRYADAKKSGVRLNDSRAAAAAAAAAAPESFVYFDIINVYYYYICIYTIIIYCYFVVEYAHSFPLSFRSMDDGRQSFEKKIE